VREKLSALVDGELGSSDLHTHLIRLRTDHELRGAWSTYHLIGDALRGHFGPEIIDRVAARLRDEPTVLAPRAAPSKRFSWYAMPAAAGIAAVALVVWTASPMWKAPESAAEPVASVSSGTAGSAATVAAGAPSARAKPPVASAEVENYLLAHHPFSHTSAMQGIAPYARTVADERGTAGK
jgi:sigma-E factor negative regulatory protein RseA